MVATMVSLVGCSALDIPLPGGGNNKEEEVGNDSTGSEIPEEPLTSGPATVSITRATATTARFEGGITNDEIDLDFVQVILRYAEPEKFSAMSEEIPSVVFTRPDFDTENKFSFRLEELRHNTTYKFCAIVQYKNDVFYSDVQEFKTAGVAVKLDVKEGSVTENSVELLGSVGGISPEDEGEFEVGMLYSDDKALLEKGEGEKILFDNIAEDGSIHLHLQDLYGGGPKYYFQTYVKQQERCDYGTMGSFELVVGEVRRVKKIIHSEKVQGEDFSYLWEFDYDKRGNIVASTFSEWEEVCEYTYEFTYDYSTKGKVMAYQKYYLEGELSEEITFNVDVDNAGRATAYDYIWEDGGEFYNFAEAIDYTPEGYIGSFSGSEDGVPMYIVNLDYADGCLQKYAVDRKGEDEDYDTVIETTGFSGNILLRNTNVDINRMLIPFLYPEVAIVTYGALKLGPMGGYYFGRMLVESTYYMDYPRPMQSYTTDPNYKEITTYKGTLFEDYEDEFCTLPITGVNYDKDGYPTEFVVDVRQYDVEMNITYAAGEVAWRDDYDGSCYYEVVEIDREIISQSPSTTVGQASTTIEYCE